MNPRIMPKGRFLFLFSILISLSVTCSEIVAATYYISPTGSDYNSGASTSPWKNFAYATSRLGAGDMLVLQDGTYTKDTNGPITASLSCTAELPCTIQAEHQRAAWIQGDGTAEMLQITGDYWTIDGLQISDSDLANQPYSHTTRIYPGAENNTIKNCLIYQSNRYNNAHLILIQGNSNLIEENEFYDFHRGAVCIFSASNNVVRRNYSNSTAGPRTSPTAAGRDIPSGYISINTTRGDEDFFAYPGNDNIFENNISENSNAAFFAQGVSGFASSRNKFLGNIAIGAVAAFGAYTSGADALGPIETLFVNNLALDSTISGFFAATSRGTRFDNCTAISTTGTGFLFNRTSTFDFATLAGYSDNSLSMNHSGSGFLVDTEDFGTFLIDYPNSYNNGTAFYPVANHGSITKDPSLGSCKCWIPSDSPMKGAGRDGGDIGANILYRYENGVLSGKPLWNANGSFPHGDLILGVNDVVGASAFDVRQRLNVNANGCPFPAW